MKTQRAERLRITVDFLPPETKRAMLDGLERNRIITGANTDRRGGMCPMIAADRNAFESGPMADIFAAVWDSYNRACILNRRDATERDLRTLKTMLETSLANSPELSSELGQAWLDYHVGSETPPGADIDFGQELTNALQQSALLDTGSLAAVGAAAASAPTPGVAPAAPPPARERKIELVCDGGSLPSSITAPTARPARIATPKVDRNPVTSVADEATGSAMNSSYEPYRIAPPKRRTQVNRPSVDSQSRAARHAAQTADTVDRAKARAIIANQAATLRGRAWPRSAEAPAAAKATPAAPGAQDAVLARVKSPRPETAPTPFAAPAIRQAAIPQRRTPVAAPGTAPATPGTGRPHESNDRTAELQGATGWSWLPPFRSYDDYEEALENAGQLEPGPRAVPEIQPPEEQRRPVRI